MGWVDKFAISSSKFRRFLRRNNDMIPRQHSTVRVWATRMLTFILLVFIWCEYLVYYVVLLNCSWPTFGANDSVYLKDVNTVKAMILADPHLLGKYKGHWFDKLRREWQMYRSFQTCLTIHSPDVVFILGDVFDEGLWASPKDFQEYVQGFHTVFSVPKETKIYVAVGNHDIGFHYSVRPFLHDRFARAFEAPPIRLVSINGINFVLLNSMAMEGDGCYMCSKAITGLKAISRQLQCARGISTSCDTGVEAIPNSAPILMQHFPLFRVNDADCTGEDSASDAEKEVKFRQKWECLSKASSDLLVRKLRPRLAIDGHAHSFCHVNYTTDLPGSINNGGLYVEEYTVASFSWRNRNNPSFLLAKFRSDKYAISKCMLPREYTIIFIYVLACMAVLFWTLSPLLRRLMQRSHLYIAKER